MRKVSTEEKLNRIHDAAIKLIERREANDISIYDIAKECGMATSTVYHHYPNIESVYNNLIDSVFSDFDEVMENSIVPEKIHHWSDINRMIESGYIEYYAKNAIAQKLILSGHTFSELTHADVENDLILGKRVEEIYRTYFDIPTLPKNFNIFTIALQAADKVYSLSYREHNCIKDEMAEEGIKLSESYLSLYIPHICPRI
jgi:AcrR family transcriptional regulator